MNEVERLKSDLTASRTHNNKLQQKLCYETARHVQVPDSDDDDEKVQKAVEEERARWGTKSEKCNKCNRDTRGREVGQSKR